MKHKQSLVLVVIALALIVVLSGCQSMNAKDEIRTVVFVAKDHSFSGPDTIHAGWIRLQLDNQGPDYDHIQLVRLKEGKTIDDLTAALMASPEWPAWVEMYGGPNAPDPGTRSTATVNLDPGNYVLLSWIPDKDGTPHYAKGMIKALTVTPIEGQPAPEPTADVTVGLHDFNYSWTIPLFSEPVGAGQHTIRVKNEGTYPHEVWVARLAPGKTAEDLLASLAPDAPADAWDSSGVGGITEIEPGTHAYFSVDLEPGRHALLCFVFDHEIGAPHAALGMVQEFTVQ